MHVHVCGYWCTWGTEVCLEHPSRSFFILYIEAVSLFKNKLSDLASLAGQFALGIPFFSIRMRGLQPDSLAFLAFTHAQFAPHT